MLFGKKSREETQDSAKNHSMTYASRYFTEGVSKHVLPKSGMPATAAYQLISDETAMDCNPALNLSSFVTTWMEPEAQRLIAENIHKNFIDHAMYPQTEIIHKRCVNMLANLYHAPKGADIIGSGTIGSSEAVMLAGLAHKFNWRKRQTSKGKPCDKPNMVFGADVQICWEKFAKFFDVEMRILPMAKDRFVMDPAALVDVVDENTICVTCILGTTFTGQNDPIHEVHKALEEINARNGLEVPIHVDAASGGFITPFIHPDFIWDFRLPLVKSINVSGHKYGLVYPGIGWLVFREREVFPEDLIFYVNYLGGQMPTMTLNFSRGCSMILAQYYNFLRLGKTGYTRIGGNCMANARYIAHQLEASKRFEIMNKGKEGIPVVAMRLMDSVKGYSVFDVSARLRQRGWVLSAYTLPPSAQDVAMLRIVVREHLSRDMCQILITDILKACEFLETHGGGREAAPTLPASGKMHIHC